MHSMLQLDFFFFNYHLSRRSLFLSRGMAPSPGRGTSWWWQPPQSIPLNKFFKPDCSLISQFPYSFCLSVTYKPWSFWNPNPQSTWQHKFSLVVYEKAKFDLQYFTWGKAYRRLEWNSWSTIPCQFWQGWTRRTSFGEISFYLCWSCWKHVAHLISGSENTINLQ